MRALPSGIFIVGTAVCDCVVRDLHQSSPWPRPFARQRQMCGLTLIFGVLYRPIIVHPGTTTGLYGIPVWEKLTWSGARHVRGSTMQRLFNAKTIISWISDWR